LRYLSLAISLIALLGVIVLFIRERPAPGEESGSSTAPAAREVHDGHHEGELELAVVMGRMQRYHQKFWLATKAANPELAAFYLHEMEEAMEEVAAAGIVEDGFDVSAGMRTYGIDVVEHLERLLEDKGLSALQEQAGMLVGACNSCHAASGHGMIRIREPREFEVPDQIFEP
jgi:hypothetical protein